MKPSDQIRAYIKAHPDAVLEDVAELFGRTVSLVLQYQRQVGVNLKTRKQAAGYDWLSPADVKEADRRLAELMKDPKVLKWLEENDFEI